MQVCWTYQLISLFAETDSLKTRHTPLSSRHPSIDAKCNRFYKRNEKFHSINCNEVNTIFAWSDSSPWFSLQTKVKRQSITITPIHISRCNYWSTIEIRAHNAHGLSSLQDFCFRVFQYGLKQFNRIQSHFRSLWSQWPCQHSDLQIFVDIHTNNLYLRACITFQYFCL